jgi:hypothetical protein
MERMILRKVYGPKRDTNGYRIRTNKINIEVLI